MRVPEEINGNRAGQEEQERQAVGSWRRSKRVKLAVYFINPIFPGTGRNGSVGEEGGREGEGDIQWIKAEPVCLLGLGGCACSGCNCYLTCFRCACRESSIRLLYLTVSCFEVFLVI